MTTTLLAYPIFAVSDDFEVFIERLENAFFINKTSPTDRVPILLNQIDAAVYKTLRSLCDPEPLADKSFEDLCAVLRRQYVRKLSVWKERQQFFNAFEAENEGANNWYLRLKTLAADCGFGESLETVICYKFVAGLESSEAFDKIAEYGTTLTMDELLAIAMSFEDELAREEFVENTSDEDSEEIDYEDEEENEYEDADEEEIEYESEDENEYDDDDDEDDNDEIEEEEAEENIIDCATNENQSPRYYRGNPRPLQLCFYCGEVNHDFSACVHKTSYCNFCHELGHLEKVCRHVRPDVRSEIDEKLTNVQPAPMPGSLEKCTECNTFEHSIVACPKRSVNPYGQMRPMGNTYSAFPTVSPQQVRCFDPAQSAPSSHWMQPAPVLRVRRVRPASAPKVRQTQSGPKVRPTKPSSTPKVRPVQPSSALKVRPAKPPSTPKVRTAQPASAQKRRPPASTSAVTVRPAQPTTHPAMTAQQYQSCLSMLVNISVQSIKTVNTGVIKKTRPTTSSVKKPSGTSTNPVKTEVKKPSGTSTNAVKTGVKKPSGTSTNAVKTGAKKPSGTSTKPSKVRVQSQPKKK